ncbi:hypothetical protein GUJ93_ZPchr0010g9114 [Zizania palustris]|uniref:Uncharacterized protein n=1 Tax=Zizania palustris TaxID=103762 RepID=A0A8J6BK17_ZIZPA|nr:hypothetical protein GUJ93_ZPchr0010g9114 [Zizania palustris]
MVEVGSAMANTVMVDDVLKLKNLKPMGRLQNLFFRPHCILQNLFFVGLYHNNKRQVQQIFHVRELELELLENYYMQSAAPMLMSEHIIFFINSIFSALFFFIFVSVVFYILLFKSLDIKMIYCHCWRTYFHPRCKKEPKCYPSKMSTSVKAPLEKALLQGRKPKGLTRLRLRRIPQRVPTQRVPSRQIKYLLI